MKHSKHFVKFFENIFKNISRFLILAIIILYNSLFKSSLFEEKDHGLKSINLYFSSFFNFFSID